jgi:hypothetical protein
MPNTGPSFFKGLAADAAAQEAEQDAMQEEELGIVTYTADGALSKTTGVKKLAKTSAGAFTLAAPTAAEEGRRLTLVCGTAYAHVVTATNLLDDGVTGGAKDTITMAAFVGAMVELIAMDLKWVVCKPLATVAAV